ncbi:MAG TPA: hypothetical protein VK674_00380 [Candidatus Limnocylindria bacterium]|nr:hypothetical protein [Candidatus Limnocylindria bacterium]
MIGFLAAVGFAGWVYAKMQRQTGGNTSNSVVVAGGAGLVLFLLIVTVLGFVF